MNVTFPDALPVSIWWKHWGETLGIIQPQKFQPKRYTTAYLGVVRPTPKDVWREGAKVIRPLLDPQYSHTVACHHRTVYTRNGGRKAALAGLLATVMPGPENYTKRKAIWEAYHTQLGHW